MLLNTEIVNKVHLHCFGLEILGLEICLPVNLENGKVEYNLSSLNGKYFTHTKAFFICNDAFKKTGNLFSTCDASGTWIPEVPTCDGK